MNNEIVNTFVEISLSDPTQFLKVAETLTRIGIASKNGDKLWQSCHILHKQGKYYLVHFKELFLLDGKTADFTLEDCARRNTIAKLLEDWNLIKVLDPKKIEDRMSLRSIKVVQFQDKKNWELITKYSIGNKKRGNHE